VAEKVRGSVAGGSERERGLWYKQLSQKACATRVRVLARSRSGMLPLSLALALGYSRSLLLSLALTLECDMRAFESEREC
jgi:hypothetical protein